MRPGLPQQPPMIVIRSLDAHKQDATFYGTVLLRRQETGVAAIAPLFADSDRNGLIPHLPIRTGGFRNMHKLSYRSQASRPRAPACPPQRRVVALTTGVVRTVCPWGVVRVAPRPASLRVALRLGALRASTYPSRAPEVPPHEVGLVLRFVFSGFIY